MRVNKLHAGVVAALTGVGGFTYQTASAQEGGLEEIVVTATRREQNLQEVPISIVALSGDTLEQRGLETLEDVSQAVPNIVITGGGGGTGGAQFRVRGIPNVSTYVDGVWQVAQGGFLVQEFTDIDRVEVLRGPQGTMFGRDSMGGAVRLWTKRPGDELAADVTATVGSLDRRDVKASLDVPFSDTFRSKFTASSLNRDGYIYSQQTGESGGYVDQETFRADFVWEPTDSLAFRLNYMDVGSTFTEPRVQDAMFNTYDEMRTIIGLPQFYELAGAEPYSRENLWAGYPGGRVGQWENRSDITLPNDYQTEQTTLEVNWDLSEAMNLMFLSALTQQDSDSYVDWDNSPYALVNDYNRTEFEVFSQEIQLTGGGDRITWLAGAYYWDQEQDNRNGRWQLEEFYQTNAGTPSFYGDLEGYNGQAYNVNTVFATAHCNPLGQNGLPIPLVPLATPNPNKPWLVRFQPGSVDITGRPLGGDATGLGAFNTCQQQWDSVVTGSYDTLSVNQQDGYAIFGEVTVKLGETWDLTVGVRQHDQSGYSQNRSAIAGVTAPKPHTVNLTHVGGDPFAGALIPATYTPFEFDKLTSRAVLQKTFDDSMIYVSYSEGFNSGGVSAPTILGVRTILPFDPSTLVNYEVGYRSDLADGRVRFNATVFQSTWEDMQVAQAVLDPVTGQQLPTLYTANVATSEAEGVEFEVTFVPSDAFLINLNLGLLDTGYTEIGPRVSSGHLPLTTGTEFQLAPEETWSAGFQHNGNLSNGSTITSRIDVMYQGQFWRNEPFLRVDAYQAVPDGFDESGDWTTVNARVTFAPADAAWSVSLFGTNLTDEYMINSGFFHGIWGYDFATVGRPREVGASMNVRF